MLDFLKNVLAVVVGVFITLFVFFLLIGGIIAGIGMAVTEHDEVHVKDKTVLVIDMNRKISELGEENPLDFIEDDVSLSKVSSLKLVSAIKKAKDDPKIVGIKLLGGYPEAGLSTLAYIERSIDDFKKSGKFVYAYADGFSELGYCLSSVSDYIVMSPTGLIEFNGISFSVIYYKRMLEKLDIKVDVFKVGDFKSAVEPFLRENMSEENKKQLTEIAREFNDYIITKTASNRGITETKTRDIQDNMLARTTELAIYHKLVDAGGYESAINEKIETKIDTEVDDINFLKIDRYMSKINSRANNGNIAVVVAEGVLRGDKNDDGTIGGDETAKLIRKLRKDDQYKAIVLRVNSPGGSILASDKIWSEVQKTSGVKPIIVSMGDLAASGGYYISASADKIVAEPTTITGSIGIFFVRFNAEKLLKEKLGVDRDYIQTGKYSDIMTIARTLNDEEKAIFQEMINYGYEKFISKVSIGRSISKELVKEIASGRVWTGRQALERKLVDKLGDISDAIDLVAVSADLQEPKVDYYPEQEEVFEKVFKKLQETMSVKLLGGEFEQLLPYIEKIKNTPNGVYAELPYQLIVE